MQPLNNCKFRSFLFLVVIFFFQRHAAAQMRQVFVDSDPDNALQKISFYSPAAGFAAFTKWIGYTQDSGRTFTKKYITTGNVNYNGYSVNLTFGFGISGVKAFDQSNIIVYGDYGLVPAILYSTDGGNSFTLVYHSQFNQSQLSTGITDLVFPENNNIGYAIDADRLIKSTDHGLHWTPVIISPGSFFSHLEAVDNNNLILMSPGSASNKLLKTTNGWLGWQELYLPAFPLALNYAYFLSADTGWITMYDSYGKLCIYKTIDAGASWILKNDPEATPFNCRRMKFINDSTGFAITNQFRVYKTFNSGATWEPLPRDNNFDYLNYSHNDLQCISPNQLWAGGGHGFLEINTNGGGNPLPKAYFRIDTTGLAVSGGNVNLLNYSRAGYQYKWYANNVLIGTSYNSSYSHYILSPLDSVKLVVISGALTDSLTRYQNFYVPNLPAITSFSPTTGSVGTQVTIMGTSLTDVTEVKFGGTPALSFTIVSGTKINAVVANGTTGAVTVADANWSSSLAGFTYFAPPVSPPPVITSFSPPSGPVGTAVTITGNNFSGTPSANVVYFGATRASVISASPTQLICTVPVGASFEPVSVLNHDNNLEGISLKPFNVSFADSSYFCGSSFRFGKNLSFSADQHPVNAMGKDLDGDGKPDVIALVSAGTDIINVYQNTGNGNGFSFGPAINVGTLPFPGMGNFDMKDIDGDGKPDIAAVTGNHPSGLVIMRNSSAPGNISFDSQVNVATGLSSSTDVAIADIDNDGKNDVAVAQFDGYLSIIRNTSVPGFLSFAPPNRFVTDGHPKGIAVGDLDGDGKKDVVTYNYLDAESSFSAFRNTGNAGNISFAAKVDFPVPGSTLQGSNIIITDYDNDNKPDVIILNDGHHNIFRNICSPGNIAFEPVLSTQLAGVIQGSSMANLSGDSKPDMLAGNWSLSYFSLFRNTSVPGAISTDDGVAISESFHSIYSYNCHAADFDLDGKPDVIAAGPSYNIISIFKNYVGIPLYDSACAGADIFVDSDFPGINFQWQQDSGSGFVNIIDTGNYFGTNTNSLYIQNPPHTWYGYKFRCISDGFIGAETKLINSNTWTGTVSSNWDNPQNWSCNEVPDAYTDVLIHSGTVVINSNVTVRSLAMSPGVSLTVNPGFNLAILH